MRNYLLATVASVAMVGLSTGSALAYALPQTDPYDMQSAWNAPKNTPDPGKVIVRLNGFVAVDAAVLGTTGDHGIAGTPNAAAKDQPYGLAGYFRMYFGIDGRTTNGLIYGANTEMRTNFAGPNGTQSYVTATSVGSASGQSTASTWYTRRAFVYLGGDSWGIVRLGANDGPVGIFDESGVTTGEAFSTGGWDGDGPNFTGNAGLSWPFFDTGNEYDPDKITYMTPNIGGFMAGVSFAPSNVTLAATGGTGAAGGLGDRQSTSGVAADATRPRNIIEIGARYKGPLGPVGVEVYAGYVHADTINDYAPGVLHYYDLSEVDGGLALTFAGVTAFGHIITGNFNAGNSETLMPKLAGPRHKTAGFTYIAGAQYSTGPWTAGGAFYNFTSEGSAAGTSALTQTGAWVGGNYNPIKGLNFYLEYLYGTKHQAGVDFIDGTASAALGNRISSNTLVSTMVVSW
jgi:hypothetical protein